MQIKYCRSVFYLLTKKQKVSLKILFTIGGQFTTTKNFKYFFTYIWKNYPNHQHISHLCLLCYVNSFWAVPYPSYEFLSREDLQSEVFYWIKVFYWTFYSSSWYGAIRKQLLVNDLKTSVLLVNLNLIRYLIKLRKNHVILKTYQLLF